MATQASRPDCCAVILAGGLNSRMRGNNKAFLEVGGRTILERMLQTLAGLFTEILLVTRQPEAYRELPVRVVDDLFEARSSLTGIHAGLTHCRSDYAFIVPCDAPFVQVKLVQYLLGRIAPDIDVVVPVIEGHYEPLCAIYSKRCLAAIEHQLELGDYTIVHFFDQVRLKKIPAEAIRTADRDLISFFNVNTPESLQHSRRLAESRQDRL